jgi:CheY-like chemotaxis protein
MPVAIILDIHLPGISGWEVLDQLMENPVTAAIPVIICSVDEQIEERPGVTAYLRKPITPENIVKSVRQVIPSLSIVLD